MREDNSEDAEVKEEEESANTIDAVGSRVATSRDRNSASRVMLPLTGQEVSRCSLMTALWNIYRQYFSAIKIFWWYNRKRKTKGGLDSLCKKIMTKIITLSL
jgi:hypothetical protein